MEEAETLEDKLDERAWDDPESETTIEGKLIVEEIKDIKKGRGGQSAP